MRSRRERRLPENLTYKELGGIGLSHAECNYFAAMMTASVQQTEDIEEEAQRNVRIEEFECVVAGI
jgi:hypothetical protein